METTKKTKHDGGAELRRQRRDKGLCIHCGKPARRSPGSVRRTSTRDSPAGTDCRTSTSGRPTAGGRRATRRPPSSTRRTRRSAGAARTTGKPRPRPRRRRRPRRPSAGSSRARRTTSRTGNGSRAGSAVGAASTPAERRHQGVQHLQEAARGEGPRVAGCGRAGSRPARAGRGSRASAQHARTRELQISGRIPQSGSEAGSSAPRTEEARPIHCAERTFDWDYYSILGVKPDATRAGREGVEASTEDGART